MDTLWGLLCPFFIIITCAIMFRCGGDCAEPNGSILPFMDSFSELTPDRFLPALEVAIGTALTPLARPFKSYINRVYEVQSPDRTAYIAKFYRPGRWSLAALEDEHAFLADCAEIDIPVVCPLTLENGQTLVRLGGDLLCGLSQEGREKVRYRR